MATPKVQCFAGYSVAEWCPNVRLVTTHDRGYFLVSYETPVAMYDRETDVLCRTEGVVSPYTRRHIKDFGETFRPGKAMNVPQEYLNGLFRRITGSPELADEFSDDRYTCTGRDDCTCIGCTKDRY